MISKIVICLVLERDSGNNVLENFKDLFIDILEYCYLFVERREFGVGYDLLNNIKFIMFDKVFIEKYFNKLIEEYRMIVFLDIIDNYY